MTPNPYSDLPGTALEEREEGADIRLMRAWCEAEEECDWQALFAALRWMQGRFKARCGRTQ